MDGNGLSRRNTDKDASDSERQSNQGRSRRVAINAAKRRGRMRSQLAAAGNGKL